MELNTLFLLVMALLELSTASSEFVVACQKGAFPLYFNNFTQEFQRHVERSNDCNPNEIIRLCRKSFQKLSCGIPLNNTIFAQDGHARDLFDGYAKRSGLTTTVQFDTFLCDGYEHATEFNLTGEAWSDRLVVAEGQDPLSDVEWIRHAIRECGKTPIMHSFGRDCGQNKYMEMVLVCDRPKPNVRLHDRDLLGFELDRHSSQFAFLLEYAEVVRQRKNAAKHHDRQLVNILNDKLLILLEKAQNVAQHLQIKRGHFTGKDTAPARIYSDHGLKIVSRDKIFRHNQITIHKIGLERSAILIKLAADYLTNSSALDLSVLGSYNVEVIEALFYNSVFPELVKPTRDYYIAYCMQNTLGVDSKHLDFLNYPKAHVKINAMYQAVFNSGQINFTFVVKQKRYSVLTILNIALIITFVMCFPSIVRFISKQRTQNNARRADEELRVFFTNCVEENPYADDPTTPTVQLGPYMQHLLKLNQAPPSYSAS